MLLFLFLNDTLCYEHARNAKGTSMPPSFSPWCLHSVGGEGLLKQGAGSAAPQQGTLIVVIVDAGPVSEAFWAAGTDGCIFIIVTLIVITIVVMSISISVHPIVDIIFKFLEEKRVMKKGFKDTHSPKNT